MDLIKELKALEQMRTLQGMPCSAGEMLRGMEEKERITLQTILDNKSVAITHLLAVLRNNGYEVAERALYRHRNKSCRCFN